MTYCLLVDDSEIDRMHLEKVISKVAPGLTCRQASDPYESRELMVDTRPALVFLDINMPRMSGGKFLGHIMESLPTTVVIVAGELEPQGEKWNRLLELGASAIVVKPQSLSDFDRFEAEIEAVLKKSKLVGNRQNTKPEKTSKPETSGTVEAIAAGPNPQNKTEEPIIRNTQPLPIEAPSVILIGASTGGPQALEVIMAGLDRSMPPVIIAQHISEPFINSLAKQIQGRSSLKVRVAVQGEVAQPGVVYLASPGKNLTINKDLNFHYKTPTAEHRFLPNVDVLFKSAAGLGGALHVCAALLTGMGDDGAAGLKMIRQAGGQTIAQDEATCVVYGMPSRAMEIGGADVQLPLEGIAKQINEWVRQRSRKRKAAKPLFSKQLVTNQTPKVS